MKITNSPLGWFAEDREEKFQVGPYETETLAEDAFNLHAAAPRMLEALETIVEQLDGSQPYPLMVAAFALAATQNSKATRAALDRMTAA